MSPKWTGGGGGAVSGGKTGLHAVGLIRTVLDDHELELRGEVEDVLWPRYWWLWVARLIMADRGKGTEFDGLFVFPKAGG